MSKSDFPFNIDDIALNLLGLRTQKGFPSATVSHYRVLCPFCTSSHYSLDIVRDRNIWSCQACGNTGGMLDLYKKVKYGEMTSMTNGEAYKEIVEQLNCESYAPVYKKTEVSYAKESDTKGTKERHKVYSEMKKLPYFMLAEKHRLNLLNRGLTSAQIKANGYFSSPSKQFDFLVASELIKKGYNLEGIPGFYLDDGTRYNQLKKNYSEIPGYRDGEQNWAFKSWPSGFYIPIRNEYGMIVSIQTRTENSKCKYIFLSSADMSLGSKAVSCAHYAGNFVDRPTKVYLTEGPLKADIAHGLSGEAFIALPGVNNYTAMKDVLLTLKKIGVKTIASAFDMDCFTNPQVAKAVKNHKQLIIEAGFSYEFCRWDERFKGIDDYLLFKTKERDHE